MTGNTVAGNTAVLPSTRTEGNVATSEGNIATSKRENVYEGHASRKGVLVT